MKMDIQLIVLLLLAFVLLAESFPFLKLKSEEKKPKASKSKNIEIKGTITCTPLGNATNSGESNYSKITFPEVIIRESTENAGLLTKFMKMVKKEKKYPFLNKPHHATPNRNVVLGHGTISSKTTHVILQIRDKNDAKGCIGKIIEILSVSDFVNMGDGKFKYDVGTCDLNGASILCKK